MPFLLAPMIPQKRQSLEPKKLTPRILTHIVSPMTGGKLFWDPKITPQRQIPASSTYKTNPV